MVEYRPALGMETFFKTAWGLLRDGKATALGIPKNPLQLAVLAAAFTDEVYFTRPPVPVQKALLAVAAVTLAPVGRLLGYRATYPEYSGSEQTVHQEGDKKVVPVAGLLILGVAFLAFALLRPRRKRQRTSG